MKDSISVWGRFLGRSYSVVSTDPNNDNCDAECRANSPRNVALRILRGNFRGILAVGFLGLLTFGSGLFILLIHPYDLLYRLKNTFSEGGEIFELWRKPPVDLYLRVFLFNVTNRDAFMAGKEKLRVEEVGPYVYKENLSHENVTFLPNGTLSAVPYHPLIWVPELSGGLQEDDQLVLPHIALLSIAHVVSTANFVTRMGLNVIIRQTQSHPLVQMSAREFMFGYESKLMTLGYKFMSTWIDFDKLGLIDRMYNFEGDYETVFTGENNAKMSGLIDTYRGSTQLPQWEGHCGDIHNASDGTKFKGYLQPNDTLRFFRKSMCRAQTMVRVNETVKDGFKAYVYNFEQNANDNGKYRPENSCFCSEGKCLPAGLLDVHGCYYGFPVATSYPHFLDADPAVREHVEGTNPDPEKHRTVFIIQPESGLPLDVAARFQINLALGDLSPIAHVEQFSNMILPMLWTEIRMYNLPDSLVTRFTLYLNVLPVGETVLMYCLFVMGTVFVAVAAYKYSKKVRNLGQAVQPTWIDEFVEEDVNRKLSTYSYVPEKRASLNSKELQVYFNSLVAPLNQDLDEFAALKEEHV